MNSSYIFPVELDSRWLFANQVKIPSNHLQDWLLDTGSLTERVMSKCDTFSLHLVGQQQGGISPQEHGKVANSEGVIDQQQWMVREVILLGDDKPWVFARSVIPMALWQSDFTDLNTQPLGQRIFNDSKFSRMPFEITQIQQSHPFCKKMRLCPSQDLWGRRSVFRFEALNMMVCEIFLPDSPAYLPQDKVQYEPK